MTGGGRLILGALLLGSLAGYRLVAEGGEARCL